MTWLLVEGFHRTEQGGQVKKYCGGMGYEVMSRDDGT